MSFEVWDNLTICQDIRSLDVPELMKRVGIQEEELDILDGSPPCPPFSMRGKKRVDGVKPKKSMVMFRPTLKI